MEFTMEDNNESMFTIYIPHSLLGTDTCGVLLGCRTQDKKKYCIVSMLGLPENPQYTMIKSFEKKMSSGSLLILGFYETGSSDAQQKMRVAKCLKYTQSKKLPWIHLHQSSENWPEVSVLNSSNGDEQALLIVYDPHAYLSSIFLQDFLSDPQKSDVLTLLAKSWKVHQENQHKISTFTVEKKIEHFDFLTEDNSCIKTLKSWLFIGIYFIFFHICMLLKFFEGMSSCMKDLWLSKFLLYKPACYTQLLFKYHDVVATVPKDLSQKLLSAKWKNTLCRHGFDVCLGVVCMVYLTMNGYPHMVSDALFTWAQEVVTELQSLLDWLKGAPAGLKLNAQLSHCLAGFFQYHICLWNTYLHVVQPALTFAVELISMIGCLGLTVQLALIQDLLSMMTLHSYCFYVYAARLYFIQIYSLSSLWRLFRGRKWNPLRERVDSVTFDLDQLFLGTLFFTILLFLMPTTLLFYAVFAVLRIGVLFVQGMIQFAVNLINGFPLYFVFLRLFNPAALTVDVLLYPYQENTLKVFPLALQHVAVGWSDLWSIGREDQHLKVTESWTALGKKLLKGELICPWILPKT